MNKRIRRRIGLLVVLMVSLALICAGCGPAQRWLDRKGLEQYADSLESSELAQQTQLDAPSTLEELDLRTSPEPVEWTVGGAPPFEMKSDWLIQEVLRFPSKISSDPRVGQATFYVYRHGKLGARPVVLWLPGNGFAPIAFPFVRHFYTSIVERGYDLIVWVPPYHFDRKDPRTERSIFGLDAQENVDVILESVREIRTLIRYLTAKGVPRIGGWGGSLGASILWLVSALETLNHMALMIPVIDWRTITIDPPEMFGLNEKMERAGMGVAELAAAYLNVSPISYPTLVSPERIQILYARHDQLTPASGIEEFAAQRKLEHLHAYNRSHATILLTFSLYVDYANFLSEMGR